MPTPELPKIELARFRTLTGSPTVDFEVHFNPASLEHSVSNSLKEEGKGSKKKQFIDKTSAKLTMQLVFDTTDTGEDVRVHTDKVAALLRPVGDGKKQVPPNVEFSWGLYRFTGMVEKHKEVLDFFAPSGVPLRATVDLTLASQDVQFESAKNPPASVDGDLSPEPAVVPGAGGPSGVANALGDPRAARAIASANGSASLRFGGGAALAVTAGVELQAEAGFSAGASAGAGFGIGVGGGAGAGIGGGAGFGIGGGASAGLGGGISAGAGASAGVGLSAGASAGASVGFSAGGSAGVGASVATGSSGGIGGGTFSELRTGVSGTATPPSGQVLFQAEASSGPVGASATFGFGGQAVSGGGSSLGADVGAGAELDSLIRFG